MMNIMNRLINLTLIISMSFAIFPVLSDDSEIEVIEVRAQKRVQPLQKVGITMAAFGEDQLKELGVTDVVNVAANVSNVQVNYGLGNNFFNIRGLGLNEFTSNLDAPVAVHVDEVYMSKGFMTGMTLFDVEHVEVLKGPQGDLFGRNTTGGAVNFFTNKPTSYFEAGVNVGYDNYDTFTTENFISGPLSENLSGRLSMYITEQGEGYYYNTTRQDDEGAVKEKAVRGQLLWENDEGTSALLSIHYGKDKSELHPYEGVGNTLPDGSGFCPEYLNGTVQGDNANCLRGLDLIFNPGQDVSQYYPGENDPYTTQNNLSFDVDNESLGGLVRVEHQLDNALFSSITAYEQFSQDQREDSDGSPVTSVEVYWHTEFKQFTQEFRLASDFDHNDWNYIVGLFYEHDDFDNADYLTAYLPFNGLNNYSKYNQKVDAVALFAHIENELTEDLRLISGVRYSWEQTNLTGGTYKGDGLKSINGKEQPVTITGIASTAANLSDGGLRTDENVTFKAGLEWTPQEDILYYGSISTGFRSGGYSVAFAATQDELTSLEPEEIISYEIGFKSTLANRSLQFNGSIFRYDFQNGHIDVDAPNSPVPITINAAEIETIGAELDLQWVPIDGLKLTSGVGWVDAELKSDLTLKTGIGEVQLQGNRPAFNPKYTYNGQARYAWDLNNGYDLIFASDWSWRAEQYLEVNNQPSNLIDDYWIVNARIALESSENDWRISLWGKNITDTQYVTYLNDLPAFGWLLRGYGAPSTYGATFEMKF
ncbi:MAG: iron complex outermembrane receptor protein [Shewanella sp.]|jgi:iron complex outermembrane receptor protein